MLITTKVFTMKKSKKYATGGALFTREQVEMCDLPLLNCAAGTYNQVYYLKWFKKTHVELHRCRDYNYFNSTCVKVGTIWDVQAFIENLTKIIRGD